jgi:hypothetical protein
MNVSATKTVVQRWAYKWKLFSQVVTFISDEPFASIFSENDTAGYFKMHTMIFTAMRTSDLIETADCFLTLQNWT